MKVTIALKNPSEGAVAWQAGIQLLHEDFSRYPWGGAEPLDKDIRTADISERFLAAITVWLYNDMGDFSDQMFISSVTINDGDLFVADFKSRTIVKAGGSPWPWFAGVVLLGIAGLRRLRRR